MAGIFCLHYRQQFPVEGFSLRPKIFQSLPHIPFETLEEMEGKLSGW